MARAEASFTLIIIFDVALWMTTLAFWYLGWYYGSGLWYHIMHIPLIIGLIIVTFIEKSRIVSAPLTLLISVVTALIDLIILFPAIAFFYQCFVDVACPGGVDSIQYAVYVVASLIFLILSISALSQLFAIEDARLAREQARRESFMIYNSPSYRPQ